MPEPRPLHLRFGAYDDPPSSGTSNPRTRRAQLRRALQDTSDLARDVGGMADSDWRPRATLLSPISRRRRRSPSNAAEGYESERPPVGRQDSRAKRRRVDEDTAPSTILPIKYGYYGQVEPGRLKLEIISCDGGEHVDPRHPGLYLGAKNILQHNKSVYCSSSSGSNIVLRHLDDTPFCLEKLHIVGPEHGFTAPVREGLVYVAMSLNDLQKYIDPPVWARRAGINSPPYRHRREYVDSSRVSPERLTLSDALRDEQVAVLRRRDGDYARVADEAHDLVATEEDYYGEDFGFGRTDPEARCEIPAISSSDAPDVIVNAVGDHAPITVLSDEDVGPEESSSQEVLDFRLQRLRLQGRRLEREYLYRDERLAGVNGLHFDANDPDRFSEANITRIGHLMSRARVYDSPQPIDRASPLPPVPNANSHSDQLGKGAEHDADADSNVTCARFQIRKGKHKVAIKFEPAISGRFMLLKLWAGRSNVDVQSVIAKGYGGGRFFPARTLA